eukprot:4208325-Prymnesium_polylepis.1
MRVPYVTGPRVAVLLGMTLKGLAPTTSNIFTVRATSLHAHKSHKLFDKQTCSHSPTRPASVTHLAASPLSPRHPRRPRRHPCHCPLPNPDPNPSALLFFFALAALLLVGRVPLERRQQQHRVDLGGQDVRNDFTRVAEHQERLLAVVQP